ncbi:GARP complex subunit Vps53 [Pseudohyphozyma bogoriensis]|nr:GARP complex subunit Vps53 [Pseudohyphozyma bogoriensis]
MGPVPHLSLPDSPAITSSTPLPELPKELLLALHTGAGDWYERDALDAFVLGSSASEGGAQLEDVLNELIGDEQALPQTPLVALLLRTKIQDIRMEIDALRKELESDQDPEKMEVIQELIGELLSQVTAIRDAATESEVVVREITRDIQSLDLAKKNLIASMNALKRFQMLVNAFEQLTRLAKARKYRETAQALGAVKQLSAYFKTFSNVDRIAAVSKGVADVQGVLRAQIMREFEAAFTNEATRAGKNQQLQDACLVIDALGEDAKNSLLSWYSLLLLRDYRRIFGSTSEAGQLDNVSRRFAWFRRVLKTHEEENSIVFPTQWSVGAVLGAGFSEVTREDLKSVLSKAAPTLQIGLLLEALQQTTDFERELSRKYSMPFESIAALSAINYGRPGPPSAISVVFEPYLGLFVDAQDKTLAEMIQGFTSSRISISPSDNPSAVLPSSTELFYFYREALEKCAKLSVRQPLLDLTKVYRKWLKIYAEDVLGGSLVKFDRRSSGEGRPSTRELHTACLVLNTAEYCQETAAQLEESLQEKIHADFKSQVSLEAEKEIFINTISSALLAILHELELSMEGAFSQMMKSPWKDVEFVSSESLYVGDLTRMIQTVIGIVRDGLEQKKYVRSVCDKVVGLVLAKFTQTIVRCRPIPQIGAEQILLDLQSLKTCLLHLPLAPGDSAPVPMTYSRYVSKSVVKVDTLLKVIMTPEEPAEEFVKHYLLLVPCQSFSDFTKVLELKGVRRAEQNNLLDLFLAKTSTATGLSDSSFLSSLDMDPAPQSLISPPTSGVNSPALASSGGNLGIFSSLPMVASGSREGSRVPTPVGGKSEAKEALHEFRRFGQRIGMASRLFGGSTN